MPLLFNFSEHSSMEIEDFQYETVEKYHGSWYFDIHDPTIHDPAMQDSCINYRNILQLCRENKVFGKVLFPEITTWLLLHAKSHANHSSKTHGF